MRSQWYRGAANEAGLRDSERRQLRRFALLCDHFAWFENLLQGEVAFELPTHATKDPSLLAGPVVAQGHRLAELERERLHLGGDPLDDINGVLDAMGMKVIGLPMPEDSDVAGGFFFESEVGPCIMVNASLSGEERTVAVAHQYCHFLADFNPYRPRICYRGAPSGADACEVRAMSFAGAFLLPWASLEPLMNGTGAVGSSDGDLEALGVYYGVPVWAVAYRLQEMGFDVGRTIEEDCDGLEKPPSGAAPDLPARLVLLALEARLRGLVTPLRMSRLLQMESAIAEEMFSCFVERLKEGGG